MVDGGYDDDPPGCEDIHSVWGRSKQQTMLADADKLSAMR